MDNTYKVIGFGDSITLGAKASKQEYQWLEVFGAQLKLFSSKAVEVINQGVGDNTISPRTTNYEESVKPSALERVTKDVINDNPDMVLICFGLNDMRFGTPVEVFQEDLDKVVQEIKKGLPKAQLLLTNVFHMTGFDRYEPRDRGSVSMTKLYNLAIQIIGEKHTIPVADVSAAMAFQDYLIDDDGVHGNDLGHKVIGNKVFECLVQNTKFLNDYVD